MKVWMLIMALATLGSLSGATTVEAKRERQPLLARRLPPNPLVKQDMVSKSSSLLAHLSQRRA